MIFVLGRLFRGRGPGIDAALAVEAVVIVH